VKHFDAIIIGTGQAGRSLAARFAAAGKTVAIIERHKFGGTCVNTGCIPTKTMVASGQIQGNEDAPSAAYCCGIIP
jgi:pyruvate/2-oxoglutarate dehydrogenase complex dihydrolipoamide dehydrogenase (E3) component